MKKAGILLMACAVLMVLSGCEKDAPAQDSGEGSGKVLYTTALHKSGEDEGGTSYLEIAGRSQELLGLLEEKAGVFVMNAGNFEDIDGEGTALYTMNGMKLSEDIDPNGRSLMVDRSYLELHDILASDGSPAAEKLSGDEYALDLLVPEKFREHETDILAAWRRQFYVEKVEAEDFHNEDAGLTERSELTEEDLSVNIIYVKDGQSWPLYRSDLVCEGGAVTDPLVQVYTGNIHCSYAHSILSQWTYFYSEEQEPDKAYEALRPWVEQCGAGESLRSVKAVG